MEHTSFLPELEKASGHFDYPLTNDYMFRSLCQKSNKALKGLISALLHIPPEQIHSVVITNPIVVGEACEDKEFRLDVRVELNGNMILNIEMQIADLHDWPERSVSYLCRIFNNLSHGDKYIDVKPAMHISILDYTLFPDSPSFYSCNKLMDEKNHHIYSSKFALNVLDLKQIALAADEDKQWKLDYWARLFKASTWEEIKMIATDNEYLQEASNALYDLNADFNVRERCRNREEYYGVIRTFEDEIDTMKEVLAQMHNELAQKSNELTQKSDELAQINNKLAQKSDELAQKSDELAHSKSELAQVNDELTLANSELAQANDELTQANSELAHSRSELVQKDLEIERLQAEIARLKSSQNA
ncbi:MAG: Rpn family recombination-promoting nuclease/putative transposase [Lachnospiraceae bacterium]|nr:Rpn family recombination-promoting nuclease/putative transposase [Lachnospiraceae bacterium]